jgi:hypothetical protein
MTRVRVALVAGLLVVAAAVAITLTRSPPVIAGSDFTPLAGVLAETSSNGALACQPAETLPQGTSAIRLSLYALVGPRLTVRVFSGNHILASGTREAGWIGQSPIVQLQPVSARTSPVKVCFTLGQSLGLVTLYGFNSAPAKAVTLEGGARLVGRLRIEYLKNGSHSWLSQALVIARHMGLGRWPTGSWIVLLELALMTGVLAGVSWLTVRELR